MNGAEILVRTAFAAGIEVCFANPGTTEIQIAAAFDEVAAIRPVLGLFEGVCSGAADGYARMKGKPAMVLMHLGPGLGNGIANLHNARRAFSPLFNVVGDHASWHLSADPPLSMDIAALSGTVSGWQRKNQSIEALSSDVADAVSATLHGQIATLIIPNDSLWFDHPTGKICTPSFAFDPINHQRIDNALHMIRAAKRPAIIMGGCALRRRGLTAAWRIRALTGCDLLTAMQPACMDRGVGLPAPTRIPYFPEEATSLLSAYDVVILVGTSVPVSFFGYRDGISRLVSSKAKMLSIASEKQNAVEALEALADSVDMKTGRTGIAMSLPDYQVPAVPHGKLTAEKACMAIAALQPDNAVIVDEGITSSFHYFELARGLAPHSYMTNTGGAIGQGMPCSIGAAIACPDRPVINIQADGSAMYTVQALWTQAREGLDITTLICANHRYAILQVELSRAGYTSVGPMASSITSLDRPFIDWVSISRGMGVPGVTVTTCEDLAKEMARALGEPGPHLIEMMLE